MLPKITSRQNPIVSRYRDSARGRPADSLLLDGAHLVAEALAAGLPLRHVAVSSDALERDDIRAIVDTAGARGIDIAAASTAVMQAISPVRSASQIVAIGERPAPDLAHLYSDDAALVVIAADVQDPGNVGAIVRVAEAGGARGLVAAGRTANPFGWKALRGSMGSVLRLPTVHDGDASTVAGVLRAHRLQCLAAAPAGAVSFEAIDWRGPIACFVGSEGAGLPEALLEMADRRIRIPMAEPVESLNVAVSAGVLLYEARRQRTRPATASTSG
jgi:TrmH family RNA methyltransferase